MNVKSSKATVVIFPGGPGLTCDSISELRALSEVARVVEINPPQADRPISYDELYRDALARLSDEPASLILIGHSFGGILAADLATRLSDRVVGLACLATPFSSKAFESVNTQYEALMNDKMKTHRARFDESKTNANFRSWIASYGTLYFTDNNVETGERMLLSSRTEFQAYLGACDSSSSKGPEVLVRLRDLRCEKLLLYGERDHLVIRERCLSDANSGDLIPVLVPEASHFLTFDNPTFVIQTLIPFVSKLMANNQLEVS